MLFSKVCLAVFCGDRWLGGGLVYIVADPYGHGGSLQFIHYLISACAFTERAAGRQRDRYKYELLLHLDRKITKTEMKGNLLNRQSSHYLKEEAGDWVAWVASTCLGSPPIQAAFH